MLYAWSWYHPEFNKIANWFVWFIAASYKHERREWKGGLHWHWGNIVSLLIFLYSYSMNFKLAPISLFTK